MSQDIENWGSPKEQCYLWYFHDWKLKVGSSLLLDIHIFSGPSQWWWGLGVGLVVDWFLSDLIFRCLFLVSVQVSRSVMSYSLRPHGLQHARPPCVSPTPGAYSNSCSSSWWCHPTISSSVIPFSSHLQSFPASGSFPICQFFASGGQSIGVSASTSILPMNIQDWFPLGCTGVYPCSPKDSQESSPTPQFKSINSSAFNFIYSPTHTFIHDYWKYHNFD